MKLEDYVAHVEKGEVPPEPPYVLTFHLSLLSTERVPLGLSLATLRRFSTSFLSVTAC